jgi:WD40 repeat protein
MRAKMLDHVCGQAGAGTGIEAMAAPHAGSRLAIACVGLGITILDGLTGNEIAVAPPSSAGVALAWSPKGDRLAIRDVVGTMRVWTGDTASAKIKADWGDGVWWQSDGELGGLSGNAVTFFKLADGSATADTDPQNGPVIERVARSAHGELVYAWQVHGRDDKLMIRGGKELDLPASKASSMRGVAIDGTATHAIVWRAENSNGPTGEVVELDLAKGTADVVDVAAAPKGVALGEGGVWVAAEEGGVFVHRFGVKGEKKLSDTGKGPLKDPVVTAMAVSGDVVAVGLSDGRVALVSLDGDNRGILPAHDSAVTALAFTPDGKRLASSSDDGTRVFALE